MKLFFYLIEETIIWNYRYTLEIINALAKNCNKNCKKRSM